LACGEELSHPNAEAPPTGFALRCLLDQELSPELKLADRLGVGCRVSGGLIGDNWRGCRWESAAGDDTTSDTVLALDEAPGPTREDVDLEGLKNFHGSAACRSGHANCVRVQLRIAPPRTPYASILLFR